MNLGACGCCDRIMDLRHGVCVDCPAPVTDGGGLGMCAYHETQYGEPDPDCEDCREAGAD